MTQKETDLEHELSAALIKVDDQRELLKLAKEENEEKRKDILWTMGERAKLMDRNNRLEEAGDDLCAAAAFQGLYDKIDEWNKAKEAK